MNGQNLTCCEPGFRRWPATYVLDDDDGDGEDGENGDVVTAGTMRNAGWWSLEKVLLAHKRELRWSMRLWGGGGFQGVLPRRCGLIFGAKRENGGFFYVVESDWKLRSLVWRACELLDWLEFSNRLHIINHHYF